MVFDEVGYVGGPPKQLVDRFWRLNRSLKSFVFMSKKISSKIILEKISVAPKFFLYHEYFDKLHKFFKNWISKESAKIARKYGSECMKRIDNNEIPIDEETELKMKKTLKGKDLKVWEKKEFNCFLAFVEINDIENHSKAFYYSFLIYIFSEFENIVNGICREYAYESRLNIRLNDIAGRGIERAITYMKKVAKFNLPEQKLISDIFLIRDIRNCLAHSGGEIDDNILLNRIKQNKLISVLNQDYSSKKEIRFNENYCKHAVDLIEKFLLTLVKNNPKYLWHW